MAFVTAVIWAFAVILFKKSGESVHPIALNLFKTGLATVLVLLTLLVRGESPLYPASAGDYALLVCSGVTGITVADSLFFMSLNRLGAGLSAIIDCLYSPFIILLSVLFLGEYLNWIQILGALLIVSAVLTAITRNGRGTLPRRDLVLGVTCGALAMAIMAISIVMVKPLISRSPLLWATEIRLIGGGLALCVHVMIHPQRRTIVTSLYTTHSWRYSIWGSFLGAYVAMVLWMGGMKYAQASTAAALNQTSNIFVFLFAAWFLKERITWLRSAAICAAVLGALLVTFG